MMDEGRRDARWQGRRRSGGIKIEEEGEGEERGEGVSQGKRAIGE
jgi:hypothetical protein